MYIVCIGAEVENIFILRSNSTLYSSYRGKKKKQSLLMRVISTIGAFKKYGPQRESFPLK